MERRNTILLTVIAAATLLVAIVGTTFAYFIASTTPTGDGNQASLKTQNLGGVNLTFTNTGEQLNMLNYPGGLGIYGATAEIKRAAEETDTNNYKATFDLEITYTNQTQTDLTWELWMLDKPIGELSDFADGGFAKITTCEVKKKIDGTKTYYWYDDKEGSSDGEEYKNGQCDGEHIKSAVQREGGTMIAHGKFPKGSDAQKIDKTTDNSDESGKIDTTGVEPAQNNLGGRELKTKGPASKVYYLVVKYPNEDKNQATEDGGKDIKVTLAINESTANSELDTSE